MPATKVIVNIPGEEAYDVRIGGGVLANLGAHLRKLPVFAESDRALVVTDENVAPLYRADAKEALAQAGFRVSDIAVPAGEGSKSVEVAGEIWEAMASLALGRDCVVVALGGGVVGDLAGFVAATYMRGVPVVQVPTTLLSMVDSSVGGKTGVNLAAGKNLVGAFKQPAYVCADTATLATLDEREWACGCAEIAKSAVIDSDDFFFWLVDAAGALAARTVLPVIGIPVKASALDGLDALLSTVQMPGGIPVATVAINGSENAALLAAQILATGDEALALTLEAMRRDMEAAVLAKDAALNV